MGLGMGRVEILIEFSRFRARRSMRFCEGFIVLRFLEQCPAAERVLTGKLHKGALSLRAADGTAQNPAWFDSKVVDGLARLSGVFAEFLQVACWWFPFACECHMLLCCPCHKLFSSAALSFICLAEQPPRLETGWRWAKFSKRWILFADVIAQVSRFSCHLVQGLLYAVGKMMLLQYCHPET